MRKPQGGYNTKPPIKGGEKYYKSPYERRLKVHRVGEVPTMSQGCPIVVARKAGGEGDKARGYWLWAMGGRYARRTTVENRTDCGKIVVIV